MFSTKSVVDEGDKKKYLRSMEIELPELRAMAQISQGDLAKAIGVSRQTYSAVETGKKGLTWTMYLALAWFFDNNLSTREQFAKLSSYPEEIIEKMNDGVNLSSQIKNQAVSEVVDLLNALDEPAIHALKTMLLVEYARCRKISGDVVVKAFEGMDFKAGSVDIAAEKALRNIRKKQEEESKG